MPPTTAARWITISGCDSSKSRTTLASCIRSQVSRRGTVMAAHPLARSAATTWLPRNPEPPVTSTRLPVRLRTIGPYRIVFDEHVVADHEHVHLRTEKT